MRTWTLVLMMLAAACRREAANPREGSVPVQVDAGARSEAGSPDAGPWVVTEAELDAFIAYQREMLGVWARTLKDLERGGTLPGGEAGARARTLLGDALSQRAKEEAKARQKVGLSEARVDAIERLVADVLLRRSLEGSGGGDALGSAHAEILAKLPPEARAAFQQSSPVVGEGVDGGRGLAAERAGHGDENVERVLAREAELMALWTQLMEVWGRAGRR